MKKLLALLLLTALLAVGAAPAALAESAAAPDPRDPALFPVSLEIRLTTAYYSVTLPENWFGAFDTETVVNQTGMWLKLFFTQDISGYRGHLFSIYMVEDNKYEIIASHKLIGDLTDTEGKVWHIVAVYPTDVQYSKEGREDYMERFTEAGDILATLEPAEGCVFVPAAPTE